MLRPLVDPNWWTNPNQGWRGQIGQNFTSQDWATWFKYYQTFIWHFAELSQKLGIEEYCIGGELVAAQQQTQHFRDTIAGVRQRYKGTITYSANWGRFGKIDLR